MSLARNEIRHRAIKFANEWKDAAREAAEKQTYWNEFFDVFGISRKAVASFEAPVKKITGHDGCIDLFWKGNLIVEHKSPGGDLGKAQSQAFEYIHALFSEGKHNEIPRDVIVSDFARIVLYDLEPEEQLHPPLFAGHRVQVAAEFPLAEFHKSIRPFAFIAGYRGPAGPATVPNEAKPVPNSVKRVSLVPDLEPSAGVNDEERAKREAPESGGGARNDMIVPVRPAHMVQSNPVLDPLGPAHVIFSRRTGFVR